MAFLVRGAFRDVLEESLGSEHVQVISKLDRPMLDAKLSSKVRLEGTRVRCILNELHEKRLVQLKRTRGPREGWFFYYWSRREDNIRGFVSDYINVKLNNLTSMLNVGRDEMQYSCGCSTVDYSKAIEESFSCLKCGQTFTNFRTSKELREINSEIRRLSELKDKGKII